MLSAAQYRLLVAPGGDPEGFFLAGNKHTPSRHETNGPSGSTFIALTVISVVQHGLQNPSARINKPVVHLVVGRETQTGIHKVARKKQAEERQTPRNEYVNFDLDQGLLSPHGHVPAAE